MNAECVDSRQSSLLDDIGNESEKKRKGTYHTKPSVETVFGKELIELFMPEFYSTEEVEHLAYGSVVKSLFYDVEFQDLGAFTPFIRNIRKSVVYELQPKEETSFIL